MIEYTPLSAEGKARILNGFMKPRLSRTQSVEQPKIVLVGAQPGAGKSKAASLAKSELRQEGGYIHVDADIMRALIPAPEGWCIRLNKLRKMPVLWPLVFGIVQKKTGGILWRRGHLEMLQVSANLSVIENQKGTG